MLTRERYFWPFYKRYVPDHARRCEAAIRWAADHGYQPVFFHEGSLGGPEWLAGRFRPPCVAVVDSQLQGHYIRGMETGRIRRTTSFVRTMRASFGRWRHE